MAGHELEPEACGGSAAQHLLLSPPRAPCRWGCVRRCSGAAVAAIEPAWQPLLWPRQRWPCVAPPSFLGGTCRRPPRLTRTPSHAAVTVPACCGVGASTRGDAGAGACRPSSLLAIGVGSRFKHQHGLRHTHAWPGANAPPSGLSTVLNVITSSFFGVRVTIAARSLLARLAARNDLRRGGCFGDRNLERVTRTSGARVNRGVAAHEALRAPYHPPWFVTFARAIVRGACTPVVWGLHGCSLITDAGSHGHATGGR